MLYSAAVTHALIQSGGGTGPTKPRQPLTQAVSDEWRVAHWFTRRWRLGRKVPIPAAFADR
jgi:hypothetical protein